MSDLNDPQVSSLVEANELKARISDIQSEAHILRVLLLFVIGALCLFFWREASYNGMLAQQMQPQVMQASQYAEALSKQGSSLEKQLQAIQGAVSRLVEYGKIHPDYVPILNKYGIPVTAAATPASPVSPAPKK